MKRLLIATIVTAFSVWLTIWLLSKDVAREGKAAKEEAFQAQFEAMKPLAESGDAKAQYIIARLYHEGKGVDKNLNEAARWYAKAAEKGHYAASYNLGHLYENGLGVRKNILKAIELYTMAAGIGANADAQFALGQVFFKGSGVAVDYNESIKWTLKAARQGHGAAQFIIGSMYQDGWSVKSDFVEAYMWYTLAIPKTKQAMALDPHYNPTKARAKLMTRMNKFQISKGERKFREYKGVR